MPTPRKDEQKSEFIDRCLSDDEAKKDFPNIDQRFAFCNSKFEQHNKDKAAAGRLIKELRDD